MTTDGTSIRTSAAFAGSRPGGLAAAGWWLYEHAPARLDAAMELGRRYLAPLLKPRLAVHHHRLEGAPGGTALSLGDGMTLSFLLQRLGPAAVEARSGCGYLKAGTVLRQAADEDDLVLAMLPRLPAGRVGRECLRVPGLVSLRLEVGQDLDATLAAATTTVRRDARRVLETGFTWTVSDRAGDFERFYDDYYAPSVRIRFGDLGVVRERAMLRRQFRHGGALIWLEQLGRRVAGTVVQVRRGVLHGLVAAADPLLQHDGRAGPQFAVKIAAMALARELGAHAVDLGGTVPSLRDGGLRAKRAFGAAVTPFADSHRELLLAWRPDSFASRRLLHEAPLLFACGGGLSAVAAPPPGKTADAAAAVELWRQLAPRGLQQLFLLGAPAIDRLQADGSRGDGPIVLWPDAGANALAGAAADMLARAHPVG
ncbi:MAG: GNAT family N-acetyltransferase [Geminicoccaceae bacterium]